MSLIPKVLRLRNFSVSRYNPRIISNKAPTRLAHKNPFHPTNKLNNLAKFTLITAIGLSLYSTGFGRNALETTTDANHPEGSLRQRFNFIDKVVKKCASSVVYIEIRDPRKIDAETGESIVESNGSGFFVRSDGLVLTNAHVVINKPHSLIMVILEDGTSYRATVEDADMNIDLALLKIQCDRKVPFLRLGNSSDVSTGEWVIALGSPLSLSNTVTAGVISAVNREAGNLGLKNFSMRYIQTDAAITFGNSGGPLVNLDGDVVGINNLRVTAGIAFAIPVEYAQKFLERSRWSSVTPSLVPLSIVSEKKIFLGITTISITPKLIGDLKTIEGHQSIPQDVAHGVFVWKIVNGTPAHSSGFEVGDIITHVNGFPVHEAKDIYAFLRAESKILNTFDVIREGKKKKITIKEF